MGFYLACDAIWAASSASFATSVRSRCVVANLTTLDNSYGRHKPVRVYGRSRTPTTEGAGPRQDLHPVRKPAARITTRSYPGLWDSFYA